MSKILTWAIGSTYFKKWSGIVGGFAAGWLFSMTYWREIRGTMEVWGIEKSTLTQTLAAVVAASGLALSFGLSAMKTRRDKQP